MQRTLDGNASLKDQENTLGFAENVAIVKLVSYIRAMPAPPAPPAPGATATSAVSHHSNLATFEDRDVTDVPPQLTLIALADNQTVAGVLAQNPGKEAVFVSDIWVGGVIKKVVGIR